MKTYPIQFSIPTSRIVEEAADKKRCFSYISPQRHDGKAIARPVFDSEKKYYQHYSEAYFAITTQKSGWDCLRHYEILGSGCVPYFIDLENCPHNTMFRLPKDLLLEARSLSGIPSYEAVCDHSDRDDLQSLDFNWEEFDVDKYHSLLGQLKSYTKKHLTTKSIAEYFLSKLPYRVKKVLFISNPKRARGRPLPMSDYQRDLLYIGLVEAGVEICSTSDLFWLYDDVPVELVRKGYGRGFTTTRNIPADKKSNLSVDDNFDAVIMTTSSNRGFNESWNSYLDGYEKERIIWVDGTDYGLDRPSWDVGQTPSVCGFAFRREMS